jgi:hypothetical protein
VGGDQVEDADLKVNDNRPGFSRMTRFSNQNPLVIAMKLDKSNIPYGILLVYDNFNAIKFDSQPVLVDSNLEQAIIDGLLDMVVFRSEINGISSYSYYEKLHDPFKYKNMF